jgi:uncharacterized protein involved in exopolysaccharide biosynthesis
LLELAKIQSGDDITLSQAVHRIVNRKRRLLVTGVAGFLVGVVLAFASRPVFVAEVLLVPTGAGTSSQIEGLARNFAGLASLAGVNFSNQSASNRDIALATISSYQTVANFIKSRAIVDRVLSESRRLDWPFGSGRSTTWRAVEVFRKHLNVQPEKNSNLVRVTFEWYDAKTASEWANSLVADADASLRANALHTAQARLEYLQRELSNTRILAVQEAVTKIVEEELRSLAVAGADKEYVLKVVDSAVPPEKRARPKRVLIVLALSTLGLLLGLAWAVLPSESRST